MTNDEKIANAKARGWTSISVVVWPAPRLVGQNIKCDLAAGKSLSGYVLIPLEDLEPVDETP